MIMEGKRLLLCFCKSTCLILFLESAASYYPYYVNRINFNIECDGWALFDMKIEYTNIIGDSKSWKISNVNAKHEVCVFCYSERIKKEIKNCRDNVFCIYFY